MNTPDFRNYKNAEIDKTIDAAMTSLRTITGNSMDLNIMNVKICSVSCALVSIEGMISTSAMSELIFRPIMELSARKSKGNAEQVFDFLTKESLLAAERKTVFNYGDVIQFLFSGFAVIFVEGLSKAVVYGIQGYDKRSVSEPASEQTIMCAQDSFTETIRTNIDEGFGSSVFSQMAYSERPDMICTRLNQGRICVFVDGTPFVLICPSLFAENFQTMDDFTEKPFYVTFMRWLKYIAFFLAVAFPGLYVALASFHPEVFTLKLLLNLAVSEESTPYPLTVEVLVLMLLFEIMKEAGLRLPKPVGSTVSIVGGLIIGDAAVKSGLVSAPLLIVVGITTTSSFVIPSLYQQTAILRLVYILVGGGSGLYGIALCTVLLMININSMDDLAVSYTAPVTPFFSKGIKDVISRRSFRSYEKTHSTIKEYKLDEKGGSQ